MNYYKVFTSLSLVMLCIVLISLLRSSSLHHILMLLVPSGKLSKLCRYYRYCSHYHQMKPDLTFTLSRQMLQYTVLQLY